MEIRPISDLRNKFTEISKIVHENDEPVFFTKNGYGDMVVMSVEKYEQLIARSQESASAPQNSDGSEDEITLEEFNLDKFDSEDDGESDKDFSINLAEIKSDGEFIDPDIEESEKEAQPNRQGSFFGRFGRR